MGSKGGARHLKRTAAPRFWPIHVKERQFATRPKAGPHPADRSLTLLTVVRDKLKLARTGREASLIISRGEVRVDGKPRKDPRYPAGLMDAVEVPTVKEAYRILPVRGKALSLVKVNKEEAGYKLCKIMDKTTVRGGVVQLNLHDGRNIRLGAEEPPDKYLTGDTLKISVPEQKFLEHLKLEKGAYAIITGGKNLGLHGKIVDVGGKEGLVAIEGPDGQLLQSTRDYVMVIGRDQPLVELAE